MARFESTRGSPKPQQLPTAGTVELSRFRDRLVHARLGTHDYAIFLGFFSPGLPALVREVGRGFRYGAFERLCRNSSWDADTLASLIDIPPRTLARRKQEGRFRSDESDRLLRVSRVFGRAVELFEGDAGAASAWLERPLPALGNASPLELAHTEVGALEVERVILALEHGVFQ